MNRRCFSLIHGDLLCIAPGVKVLSSEDYSALQTGEQMLSSVQQDALKYRQEVVIESEQVKEKAALEGFEEGFARWAQLLADLEERIDEVEKKYEEIFVSVALAAAKKILGRELDRRDDAIVDIVSNTLKAVSQHKRITIWVNRCHIEALERHRPQLKELFESLQALSIRPRDDIEEGGCIIETEGGIINAQLEHQWESLEKAFDNMLKLRQQHAENKKLRDKQLDEQENQQKETL